MANFACGITFGFILLSVVLPALSAPPSNGPHCKTDADCPDGLQCLPPGKSNSDKSQFKCQGCTSDSTGLENCNSDFTGPTGEIISPHYPCDYSDFENCFYRITVAAGQRVQIELLDFELEDTFDYLRIYDGFDVSSTLIAELTGLSLPSVTVYESSTNVMFITFISDFSLVERGFRLQYSEVA